MQWVVEWRGEGWTVGVCRRGAGGVGGHVYVGRCLNHGQGGTFRRHALVAGLAFWVRVRGQASVSRFVSAAAMVSRAVGAAATHFDERSLEAFEFGFPCPPRHQYPTPLPLRRRKEKGIT